MPELKRRIVLSREAKSSVSLPPDVQRGLRMFCKLRGLTQAQVATDAIIGYIHYHIVKEAKKKRDSIVKSA